MSASLRAFFSKFKPKTLFGQLMLVFMGGLLALQGIGLTHVALTREYYILRSLMNDRARVMSSILFVLDKTLPENRAALVKEMENRGFGVALVSSPPALTVQAGMEKPNRILRNALSNALDPLLGAETLNTAVVCVSAVNLPGFFYGLFSSDKGKDKEDDYLPLPSVYQATVVLPLSDGNWAVFNDAGRRFPMPKGISFYGLAIGFLFSALLSAFAVYRVSRPLRLLGQAADRFGRDLNMPPLPENGPREVKEAAQAFNRMQSRIRDAVEERGRTLAALSHDLRTPLTRLRLRVEQLNSEVRDSFQKDINELQQFSDVSIDLARGYGNNESPALVDVAAMVESLMEDRSDMGQDVELEAADNLDKVRPIMVRPLCLKRCLNNLLDNALRYGGKARIVVEDSPRELTICIRDAGPGIPEAYLHKVFEPFFRLEPSRNRRTGGCGLGLHTAQSMARLHGGEIILQNMPQGGLEARAVFPRHIQ